MYPLCISKKENKFIKFLQVHEIGPRIKCESYFLHFIRGFYDSVLIYLPKSH